MQPRNQRTLSMIGLATLLALGVPAISAAQVPDARLPAQVERVELAGPRFGLTAIPRLARERLADNNIRVGAAISQFGWQFERQFLTQATGLAPITEFILLIGGLDQGVFLPSASWLIGLRTTNGTEFGIGPNVTPVGVALAMAGGFTIRSGAVNIPVNVALVPSQTGLRVSVLTGFTMR